MTEKISRRDFLKGMGLGLVAGGAALAEGNYKRSIWPFDFLRSIFTGKRAGPKEEIAPVKHNSVAVEYEYQNQEIQFSNMWVTFDAVGLPVSYRNIPEFYGIAFDDQIHFFSDDDRKRFVQMKNDAVAKRELTIFKTIISRYEDIHETVNESTPDRPIVTELPGDVLTEQELEAFGVRIIQAENTELSIRKTAFEEGGILYPLLEVRKKDPEYFLTIVLIDGPNTHSIFFTASQRDQFLGTVSEGDSDLELYKKNTLEKLEIQINDQKDRLKLANERKNQQEIISATLVLANYICRLDTLRGLNDEQWKYLAASMYPAVGGFRNGSHDQIFVSVGTYPPEMKLYSNTFFFDAQGHLEEFSWSVFFPMSFEPNQEHSFPRESELSRKNNANFENGDYAYGGQPDQPGVTLWHELKHAELFSWQPTINGKHKPVNSEYVTDIEAIKALEAVYQTWLNSEYTQNNYPFVFRIPDSKGGGYMFTKLNQGPASESNDRKPAAL